MTTMTRPKAQHTQLGILIHLFCWKIQQWVLGSGESTAGVTYLCMRIHPKSFCIFPLKAAATLLTGSRKGTVLCIVVI